MNRAWKKKLKEDLATIERIETCKLIELPSNKKVIEVKWVLKLKHNRDGSITKHKTRLVARGLL